MKWMIQGSGRIILVVSIFSLICLSAHSAHADFPPPQTDTFDDAQTVRSHTCEQHTILYNHIDNAVDQRNAIVNIATTVLSSTLSIQSALNPNMFDFLLLRITFSTEFNFISSFSNWEGFWDTIDNISCFDLDNSDTGKNGLHDGLADANHIGMVDTEKKSPCIVDIKANAIQGGTESGMITANGGGIGKHKSIFVSDANLYASLTLLLQNTHAGKIVLIEDNFFLKVFRRIHEIF